VLKTALERHDFDCTQMAQGALPEPGPRQKDPAKLFRYTLSPPIAISIIGMPKLDHIRENANWARAFTPLSETR
jgi:hypothetical protein